MNFTLREPLDNWESHNRLVLWPAVHAMIYPFLGSIERYEETDYGLERYADGAWVEHAEHVKFVRALTSSAGDIPVQTGLDDKWRWQQPPNAPGTTTGPTDITISDGKPVKRTLAELEDYINRRHRFLVIMCAVIVGEVLAPLVHAAFAFVWGLP